MVKYRSNHDQKCTSNYMRSSDICANWQKHTHVDYLDIHTLNFVSEFHKNIQQEKCCIVSKFNKKSQSAH
jgi:hypothetical protein